MPLYRYVVKTKQAETIRDRQQAFSREELIRQLKSKGFFIVSIKEAGKSRLPFPFKLSVSSRRKGKHRGIKNVDMCFFARNLAITLSSGVALLRSLDIISVQTASTGLSAVLVKVSQDVKSGLSLSDAVSKYPNVFSALWIGIMEVGEASGNLPFVLEKLADYLELRLEFERKIKGALVYPIVVTFFSGIAIMVFFKFILPKFIGIFDTFNMELPALTQMVFNMSNFVNKNFIWIVIVATAVIFMRIRLRKKRWFREVSDRIVLVSPLLGDIVLMGILERFCSTMYILLESGVPMVYSLDVVTRSIDNYVARKNLSFMKDNVKKGQSLSGELAKIEIFPALIAEITRIGEEAGNMPQMFQKISTHYQKELSTRMDSLISMFEPIMIFGLGIAIGIIVIALFLPIFKLSTMAAG